MIGRVLLLVFPTLMCILAIPNAYAVTEGSTLPQFTVETLAGEPLAITSFKGKVVYLDIWASWCRPCEKSFPWLREIQERFGAERFQVLAISVDTDLGAAREFISKHGGRFPVGIDPDGSIPELLGASSMPSSYLVDQAGRVVRVIEGFHAGNASDIEHQIERLLSGGMK